jgi:hypothetical protein
LSEESLVDCSPEQFQVQIRQARSFWPDDREKSLQINEMMDGTNDNSTVLSIAGVWAGAPKPELFCIKIRRMPTQSYAE